MNSLNALALRNNSFHFNPPKESEQGCSTIHPSSGCPELTYAQSEILISSINNPELGSILSPINPNKAQGALLDLSIPSLARLSDLSCSAFPGSGLRIIKKSRTGKDSIKNKGVIKRTLQVKESAMCAKSLVRSKGVSKHGPPATAGRARVISININVNLDDLYEYCEHCGHQMNLVPTHIGGKGYVPCWYCSNPDCPEKHTIDVEIKEVSNG